MFYGVQKVKQCVTFPKLIEIKKNDVFFCMWAIACMNSPVLHFKKLLSL